ncbi:MAG: hypothetical protein KG012_04300 [Deltaproteobacteria bacterium]|nr:hypothetical protein [Deltaproteobacteria bacterium]
MFERTYQLGDLTYLPTIAQQNLHFHGGIDGDDLYTFGVRGEIDTFPAYSLDRTAPARYYHRKLSFQIEDGIVPFQVGDVFGFAIEGGHFVWRKDGGAWSSALQITQDLQSFDSGLRIGFDFGVTPSFMQGDLWEVLCVQENRTANMLTPWRQRWKGSGDITIAFPAPVTVDCLIIDNHTLADTVVLKASDSPDFSPLIHNAAIAVSGLVCKLPAITAQYFRIETGSDEAEIGHIFLGTVMQLDLDADSVAPVKRYNMMRSNAREPFSRLRYKNHGYEITHKSFVRNPDWKKLEELIEYVKSRGDMPFFFVPNFNYPGDCIRGSLYMDSVEPESPTDMNSPEDARLYKISLTIRGRE